MTYEQKMLCDLIEVCIELKKIGVRVATDHHMDVM